MAAMTTVSTDDMQSERVRHLDDAFASYVAQMACVSPMLYVKTGQAVLQVTSDPPTPDKCVITCRSCEGPMRGGDKGRVFCSICRAKPQIQQGAPLIETMYLSAHPKYELDEEMRAIVALIGTQRGIAERSQIVSRQLMTQALTVSALGARNRGKRNDRNVYFTPESVCGCSYGKEQTRCNPRFMCSSTASGEKGPVPLLERRPRHDAIKVGGLGVKLFDVVKYSVEQWLFNLDAMIRAQFDIALTHRGNDPALFGVVEKFSRLIAKRVVLLEGTAGPYPGDEAEEQLCTRVFEQVAMIQMATCGLHASQRIHADIRAMRELAALVRTHDVPPNSQLVIDFLGKPCPELLRALPTVAADMRFAELRVALESPDTAVRQNGVLQWSNCVGASAKGALGIYLANAIEMAQRWRPSLFLQCLRYDAKGATRPLPPQGWVDNPQIARWSIVSRGVHERRRTGLDAMGQRIVLMSSALMQLNADGRFFVPGVMHHQMANKVCLKHESLSTYAYHALNEQLWPYMMGESWRKSRAQLENWRGSHLEDDVRKAASVLSGFTVDEIVARFARSASALDQARKDEPVLRLTVDKMVHKPKPHYDQWFTVCVDLLLPILAQMRQSYGIASGIAPNVLGDRLRLLLPVREWRPTDGNLRIVAKEAAAVPGLKSALVRLKAEGSALVKYTRPARSKVMQWEFDAAELARVLNQ